MSVECRNSKSNHHVTSNLKIIHQNVQGASAKFEHLEVLVELYSPDILCLSEHFLRQAELDMFHLPGYVVSSAFCRSKLRKGGVCIVSKDILDIEPLDIEHFCKEGICEFTAIKVTVETPDNITYVIVAVYRPPKQNLSDVKIFMECLNSCLEFLLKSKTMIVVTGDFNIDFSVSEKNSNHLNNLMRSFGLR